MTQCVTAIASQMFGVGSIPWSPLGRGLLTRTSRDATLRGKTDIYTSIFHIPFLDTLTSRYAQLTSPLQQRLTSYVPSESTKSRRRRLSAWPRSRWHGCCRSPGLPRPSLGRRVCPTWRTFLVSLLHHAISFGAVPDMLVCITPKVLSTSL